jgi:hypothetical protein
MATLTSMTMTSIGRQTVLKDEYKVGTTRIKPT